MSIEARKHQAAIADRRIVQVWCPTCRCDVLAEVRHIGRGRRCRCSWCDRQIRIVLEGRDDG